MKFPPTLLDDIRARLPVSQVVGRKVALKKAGREWKGLSPFKTEKSPSFFVNDQKGFYHCFASGEHGDIFTFLMKTEGLSFPEAVERLAEEAGVAMPKPEARNPEWEDQRKRLYDLMEAAATYFQASYREGGAAHARKYVAEKRGLSPETVDSFRIGYAPDSRNALKNHLAKLGYSNEEMISSGMLIGGPDIPVSYDRFRNRVMFPIADLKGRTIAFGGRALDADTPAKYLNSPETPLFHKGHNLYNAARARPAAHDKGRVIAVEGYMDVVALVASGFAESVAPLGTALTEDQTKLLWRMAPEPILCFDGDSAGQKAAFRAVDVAVPLLQPGKSVRFAFLPDGLDPDDLIRQRGREAMETALGATRSLADVLFEREWGAGEWTTPERRAQLEQQIMGLVVRIEHDQVRSYYTDDMRQRLNQAFGRTPGASTNTAPMQIPLDSSQGAGPFAVKPRPGRSTQAGPPRPGPFEPGRLNQSSGGRRWQPPTLLGQPLAASASLRQSLVDASDIPPREALILRAVLNHPHLIDDQWEELAGLDFASSAAKRLRDALLALPADGTPLDSNALRSHLTELGLDGLLEHVDRASTHKSDRFAEAGSESAVVLAGWRHALHMHEQEFLRRELALAQAAWNEEATEDAFARIVELKRLQARALDIDDEVA